jgi:hypothetical protein
VATRVPDCIQIGRHLELRGRGRDIWFRRVLLGLVALVPLAALLDVFGQEPQTASGESATAVLAVTAPVHLRGGLLFTGKYRVTARTDIADARLVLDPDWTDDMQVNSVVPQARSQTSRDGRVVLDLGRLASGQTSVTFVGYQVNPTNIGRRTEGVELDDGSRPLLRIHRTVTIFP